MYASAMSCLLTVLSVGSGSGWKTSTDLTVVVLVHLQVQEDRLYDAFYRLSNTNGQITSYVFDVVSCLLPLQKFSWLSRPPAAKTSLWAIMAAQ